MKPELIYSTVTKADQPLVCIIASDDLPDFIDLQDYEKIFISERLKQGAESVFLNTRLGYVALVRVKNDLPLFRQHESLRKAANVLLERIKEASGNSVTVTGNNVPASMVLAFAEGLVLSLYKFDKYKTKAPVERGLPEKVIISYNIPNADFNWFKISCEAVYVVRDMINEPPQKMTAQYFAAALRSLGSEAGISTEILDKSRIAALRMGGLLGVNQGSVDPPEFCIMEYKPDNAVNSKPLVLIGKGVVLDTGGLNIKPGDYMDQMKTDMAGGAAVAGAMYLIARTKVPLYAIALVPVTDNRPGQNAIAPGDVLTMHSGTTVEVMNTDAEGRLLLADAISYACRFDPMLIITIATLTGSAFMTFGTLASAIMGTAGEEYFKALENCGEEVFERVARLPFWDEYEEALKSDIADIRNLGGKESGAITAGKFLASFARAPFIHIDIAGPAMLKKNDYYRTKDGPGTGVRMLASFARNLASDNIFKNKS